MKNNIFKARASRNKIFAAITVAAIALLLAINLVLTYFGIHKTLFIDMTPEGLYTLTDAMKEECAYIDEELDEVVKITFCSDPDTLIATENTRAVYFMATELDNLYDNLEVETVNVTYNPTSVSQYKATSLSVINPTDVIISYGDRYRVIGAAHFWTAYGGETYSFNGEYEMATIIRSVTAKNRPAAYFVADHGTTYYNVNDKESAGSLETEQFYYLLQDRGLEVKTLRLSEVVEIPDDCVLLIINNPTDDLTSNSPDSANLSYISETEKIDRYLVKNHGSLMVAKDYSVSLPVFESFLYEWGFEFGDSLVSDGSASVGGDGDTTFAGVYDTDEESYGYAIYGDYAALSSAPQMVFGNTGYITCSFGSGTATPEPGTYSVTRNYAPFFYSSANAESHKYDSLTEDYTDLDKENESLTLAAVATRLEVAENSDGYDINEYYYSYVMCAGSSDFFSSDLIGNPSYANYDVLAALTENMVRTDEYASIELGGLSGNSSNYGGKPLVDTDIYSVDDTAADTSYSLISEAAKIWLTVLLMAVPIAVAVVGIVVTVKRRFL